MGRDANGALQSIKVRPLALDMDHLGTRVQLAAQKQQLFNQLMKQGSTNLLNFGKNTQWAGRQLMVGFTIPLTILGTTAAREFQKIEEQAIKFKRVYGDMFTTTADQEKALSDVRALADEFTKYGVAVEKTLALSAEVAQMGGVGADLIAQVTQATRLAVLGGIEQEEALNTTISLTSAFGVASEDLAGKIAFLNAVENQTILSIEDFNEAIPKAGAVVRQLGGDVEDLAFFLTAMREGGINASESANALKSGLASIINPTQQSIDKMKEFGIDIVGIVDSNAGNLKNTVMGLAGALNGLGDLDRARAIEQLFGKFQFARISTLFQNITKEGTQAQRVLGLTANSTAELAIIADRELSKVEDSVATKFTKQMESLQAALAPIGEEFMKAVIPILEFGTKLLKSFNDLGDGSKQFIVVLTAIAGIVAPAALMAFGLVANGVANLIKLFAFLGRGFGALSGQSTLLGTGTEYMTQQQLEAAAVAASLGQSHQNLIQVFGVETSAVNNLANAYRQATIAQGAFRATGTGAGGPRLPKPKGFATGGVIQGPGTGTSDSIFIRASNGEFVVNAKAAQENMGLLEQINNGKPIPGFSIGGPIAASQGMSYSVGGTSYTTATAKTSSAIDERIKNKGYSDDVVKRAFEILAEDAKQAGKDLRVTAESFKIAARSAATELGEATVAIARSHTAEDVPASDPRTQEAMKKAGWDKLPQEYKKHVYGVTDLTADMGQPANLALRNNNLTAEQFNTEWFGRTGKYQGAAAAGGLDLKNQENVNALQQLEDEVGQEVLREMKARADAEGVAVENIKLGDAELAAAADRVISRYEELDNALGESAKALRVRQQQVSELRSSPGKAVVEEGLASGKMRKVGDRIDVLGTDGAWVEGYARGGGSKGSYYNKKALPGSYGQQPRLSVPSQTTPDLQENIAAGERNAEAYNRGAASKAKDIKDIASEKAGRGSPHPEAFPDGVDDAKDYLRGQESVLGPNSDPYAGSNLAAPKPPTSPVASSRAGGFLSNIKGKAVNVGNRAMDMALKTGPGKMAANYFAETSGGNITNSKGEIVSDFHQKADRKSVV
jgi:TP901 family phage tail tape measure protein